MAMKSSFRTARRRTSDAELARRARLIEAFERSGLSAAAFGSVARLRRALDKLAPRYLPKSPMGQAIGYALNQWSALERFIEHGEVEIDNNLVENAIRPTAIGKKNWLFFGSEEAGRRNAVIYTLIQNCRMHGVEPLAYLKDVLERLPRATNRDVEQLTPLNWKNAREQSFNRAA